MPVSGKGQDKGRKCESGSAKRKQKKKREEKKPGACQLPLPLTTLPRGDAEVPDTQPFISFPAASAEGEELLLLQQRWPLHPEDRNPRTYTAPPLHPRPLPSPASPSPLPSLLRSDHREGVMWRTRAAQRLCKDCGQTFGEGSGWGGGRRECASKLTPRQNSKMGSPSGWPWQGVVGDVPSLWKGMPGGRESLTSRDTEASSFFIPLGTVFPKPKTMGLSSETV